MTLKKIRRKRISINQKYLELAEVREKIAETIGDDELSEKLKVYKLQLLENIENAVLMEIVTTKQLLNPSIN